MLLCTHHRNLANTGTPVMRSSSKGPSSTVTKEPIPFEGCRNFHGRPLLPYILKTLDLPRGATPTLNISCDPVQAAFYAKILDSVNSIQRTTQRLHPLQGVTSLLECDSFLRRFYQYSTGIPSQMLSTRHYANSLLECK